MDTTAADNIAKIKDRIAKLLRMAADSSSPNEAAIAASRARSLMDKHQIAESDLSGEIHDVFGSSRYGRNYKNIPTYMNILAVAVARFNDARVVLATDYDWAKTNAGTKYAKNGPACSRFIQFSGSEQDTVLASAMMDNLVSCMDRLCKEYMLAQGHAGTYSRAVGESFKIGCSTELVHRITALAKERNEMMIAAEEAQPGTGIAIISKAKKVEEQFGEQKTKKSKHVAAYDGKTAHARMHGQREGRKMAIQGQVE